jgi:hypothetical protein
VNILRTLFFHALACVSLLLAQPPRDPRHIENGFEIPDENYADQPYVVITGDGKWLCVMTTGAGKEGAPGQHIVSTISADHGRTWTPPIDIEPASGPEASWVMPLKVPYGRIYAFYNYNRDNVRLLVNTKSERLRKRVDTIGVYAFKYSDDNGRTWSKERYEIPMRKMRIDRENLDSGAILYFWGVGKPIVTPRYAIFGFAKVGKWDDPGGMVESQGCFLRSGNILTERDPRKLVWQLLPDGDEGLRAPKGAVSDEANLVALSDGSLYATYRTIDGYSCHAYSRDGGHTWTPPAYATYGPGGRPIKHNRVATFVRKFSNGKYLLWFHNHGGEQFHVKALNHYLGRNPSWLAGGIEKNGRLHWSEPEIVLYNDDPLVGSSYPDFIEEGGRYFITETQKTVARVHEVDPALLEGLWSQHQNRSVAQRGLVLDLAGERVKAGAAAAMPKLASLAGRGGFTVDFWIKLKELTAGQSILDTRDASGKGIALVTSDRSTIKLVLNDGSAAYEWDSDAGTHPGTLKVNAWQHVAVIVDAGPRIVSFVVDGVFNDGGALRDYGWGRFPKEMGDVNGAEARVAGKLFGQLSRLRVYNRYLRTAEVVGNWRAGTVRGRDKVERRAESRLR